MSPDTTRLLVIRHGESEWNVLGRWQGTADPPLTEAGVRQAQAASLALGSFDGVWASTLQRAAHTAAIIAEALGIGPVLVDRRLQENHYGEWQGLTVAEIESGWPGYIAQNLRPSGAEQAEEVIDRVSTAFVDIAATVPGGDVLVVSHAGVIRTMRRALGCDDYRFGNLSGCWFHIDAEGRIRAGDEVHLIDSNPAPRAL